MPETKQVHDHHATTYQEVQGKLPGAAVGWVKELRAGAFERFQELGFPTSKVEAWRYTNPRPITEKAWTPAALAAPGAVTDADLADHLLETSRGQRIVFVDGHFAADLTDLTNLPEGVSVRNLATVLDQAPDSLQEHLGQHVRTDDEAFVSLNTAFMQDGAVIRADRNVVARAPIQVLHVTTARANGDPVVSHPRNLVIAEKSAQIVVTETHVALPGAAGASLTNVVTELVARDNAHVEYHLLQREDETHGHHVGTLQVNAARDSTVNVWTVDFGGRLVRHHANAWFGGEGGAVNLYGLYALRGEQHVDHHTVLEHAVPHCTSDELYKGILDGKSRGVFLGKIHVHPDAQKTDAYQHNPNLLVSDEALVDSMPQLEIYADDVKCSHGSTIGQLEKSQVFYLRSRGLTDSQARAMLTYAFARDILDRVPNDDVREHLNQLLLDRLEADATLREVVQ